MARLLGKHPIYAWGNISVHGRDGIVTCLGSAEELAAVRKLLRTNESGLMVDPITLNLINELDLKKPLVGLGRPLGVTRSTIESVESYIEELSMHRNGMKTVGKQGDQYVFDEVSAETMARHLMELRDLVSWVRTHFEEVPAIAERDLPPEASRLGNYIDRSFLDTIHAARGRGWMLLSDDLYYRRLASELDVDGVWMQPLLELTLEKGAIEENVYQDAVIQLALMNHNFTSISEKTLLRAAEEDGWRVTPRLKKLLEVLASPTIEMRSALTALAKFFHALFTSGVSRKVRGRIFAAALEAFERHQIDAVHEIHRILGSVAEGIFDEKSHAHARRRSEWKKHIDTWLARVKKG